MALRMLNYLTQFCLNLAEKLPKEKAFPLPQILPVVFYTGWPRWCGPLEVGRLWQTASARVSNKTPVHFRFTLVDVIRARLRGDKNSLIRLMFDSFQTNRLDIFNRKWHNFIEFASSRGGSFNKEAWVQLFGMILEHISGEDMSAELTLDKEYKHVTEEDINTRLDSEGNMICWRTRYIAQGRAEGRAEGMAEGHSEGRTEAITADLRNLMETLGLSLQDAMNALRVPEAEQPYFRERLAH